mgnify:CR=1 FL=1
MDQGVDDAAPLPAETPDPETQGAAAELERRVQAVMASLPADMRAVLVLRAFHDLDDRPPDEFRGSTAHAVALYRGGARVPASFSKYNR